MQTFTLEADTLATVQRMTDDPAAFVRQVVADGLPLEGFGSE